MSLSELDIKYSYNKINNNIADEFYLPCMKHANSYDRISGYFGSTIYLIAWSALKEFIANGGKMRVICSPFISSEDIDAIDKGKLAKEDSHLYDDIYREFKIMFDKESLSSSERLLACLIALDILNVKVAVAKEDPSRLFHDKVGIFKDGTSSVAFRGLG